MFSEVHGVQYIPRDDWLPAFCNYGTGKNARAVDYSAYPAIQGPSSPVGKAIHMIGLDFMLRLT